MIERLTYFQLLQVALTVLEAHIKICRDLYSGNLLTEGVKHVTAAMYTPAPEKVGETCWPDAHSDLYNEK